MKRLIICYLLILPSTLLYLGNCSSEESYEWYLQAHVNILTPTSDNSFSFYERSTINYDEMDQEIIWVISANDPSVPFGISISWKESFISGPGSFQVGEDFPDFFMMIMKIHPTEPGVIIGYFVYEGIITFTQIGYQSGDIIEGTFDQLRVHESEVDEYIEVDDGIFRSQVL